MRFILGITVLLAVLLSPIASASDLAVININNSEIITFLNHSSDLQGNWIVLTGGMSVRIPEIIFNYSGISSLSYTKNSKKIHITSPSNYEIRYPFTTHQMYANNSPVNATFYNTSDLAGNIDIYLIKTFPTELSDTASRIIDGNTTPFRNLINKSIDKKLNRSLNGSNISVNWGSLNAGDYAAIIMLNETNPDNFTIASATTFQVLEYDLTASAPDSEKQGNNYDISVSLDAPGGSYTYGAFLIHNDSYKSTLKLRSNETKAGTNLSADGEFLVDAFKIAGMGLKKLNKTTVQNIVNGVTGANNGTVVFKSTGNSTSLSLITDDLKPGKYVLTVGVWSSQAGKRLVGFYQKEVNITPEAEVATAQPARAAGGGGGGSAGVTSGEPLENIENRENREEFLMKDAPVFFRFAIPEIPVKEITITANLNAGWTSVQVELLKGTSKLVTMPAPGIVYKNMNILVGARGFAIPKNIKEGIIKFRVENSWMTANNIQTGDVSMFRWENGWNGLETKETGSDADFTYFETKINAFSPFAISAKLPEAVPAVTATATPAVTVTPPVEPGIPTTRYVLIAYVFIAILIIAGAWYVFVIKKREGKK